MSTRDVTRIEAKIIDNNFLFTIIQWTLAVDKRSKFSLSLLEWSFNVTNDKGFAYAVFLGGSEIVYLFLETSYILGD